MFTLINNWYYPWAHLLSLGTSLIKENPTYPLGSPLIPQVHPIPWAVSIPRTPLIPWDPSYPSGQLPSFKTPLIPKYPKYLRTPPIPRDPHSQRDSHSLETLLNQWIPTYSSKSALILQNLCYPLGSPLYHRTQLITRDTIYLSGTSLCNLFLEISDFSGFPSPWGHNLSLGTALSHRTQLIPRDPLLPGDPKFLSEHPYSKGTPIPREWTNPTGPCLFFRRALILRNLFYPWGPSLSQLIPRDPLSPGSLLSDRSHSLPRDPTHPWTTLSLGAAFILRYLLDLWEPPLSTIPYHFNLSVGSPPILKKPLLPQDPLYQSIAL